MRDLLLISTTIHDTLSVGNWRKDWRKIIITFDDEEEE